MYESFFGLQEKPFSLTPNPRFLFLSKTHNEVYAHLLYGIEHRTGFVEVTGEVGTGKTTILRSLLAHLDESKYRVAFIFNPKLTAFELLRNINREFGVADDGVSNPDLIHALNEFLLAENRAGRTPILVIDEAQNLSGEVLEQIRLLSNLETEEDKLIQIILVGQPELRRHLSDHSLRQLNQRIAVRYHLRPLNQEETTSYIQNRLKIAGRTEKVFNGSALKAVFRFSGGIPRKINLICDRALLTAYSENHRIVTARDIKQALVELSGMGEDSFSTQRTRWKLVAFSALAVLILAVGLTFYVEINTGVFKFNLLGPKGLESQVLMEQAPQGSESTIPEAKNLSTNQETPESQDTLLVSINAILSRWEVPLIKTNTSLTVPELDNLLSARGFKLVQLTGYFADVRKYNVPLLFPLNESQGGGFLAVLEKASENFWSITPAFNGQETLSTDILNDLGANVAFAPWVDFAEIGRVIVPGQQGENVRRLQFLLGLAGCADVPTSGRYDIRTIECVKEFQRKHDLIVDGLVGPRTLIIIYQVAGAYDAPKLS